MLPMIKLTFGQLAEVLGVVASTREGSFCGVSTDTRTLEPSNLFVGLAGERGVDGAEFIPQAIEKGVAAALVNSNVCHSEAKPKNLVSLRSFGRKLPQDDRNDIPIFCVEDTTKALGQLAAFWRNKFELPIIAVTGSNGKTTIKNMIDSILRAAYKPEQVLVAYSSFNNHIGVPLSLFQLNQQHKYAVLEMGMSHFGEIAYLSRMTRPNIAIISNAFPCHLDGVGDLDGVAKAKAEIFEGLKNTKLHNSCAILNADDDYYDFWRKHAKNHKIISFSLENTSDISANNLNLLQNSSKFTLCAFNDQAEIDLPLPGKHNVLNALAATSACFAMKIPLSKIKQGLEAITAEDKRLKIIQTKQGAQILNDCYNANPASLKAAIDVLVGYPGRKILVLGDMKELGANAKDFHVKMGEYAVDAGIDEALVIGELTKHFARAFGEKARHFADKNDLVRYLQSLLAENTTILIKGSRSMKLEDVVVEIVNCCHSERSEESQGQN
jgi:UDP-N-acetylmuramoyl-tripeptide--D-alanyl-D-alanine ligase